MPNPLINRRILYMLPKAENLLRLANHNIVTNRRNGHEATVTVPSLLMRANMIVNETGVIPYRNYPSSVTLPERQ
jgi:hypothetical protein